MLHEHSGQRSAGRHLGAELPERLAEAVNIERALGRAPPLGGIEPEADQRQDHAAGAAAAQVDGRKLAGLRDRA